MTWKFRHQWNHWLHSLYVHNLPTILSDSSRKNSETCLKPNADWWAILLDQDLSSPGCLAILLLYRGKSSWHFLCKWHNKTYPKIITNSLEFFTNPDSTNPYFLALKLGDFFDIRMSFLLLLKIHEQVQGPAPTQLLLFFALNFIDICTFFSLIECHVSYYQLVFSWHSDIYALFSNESVVLSKMFQFLKKMLLQTFIFKFQPTTLVPTDTLLWVNWELKSWAESCFGHD